MEPSAGLGIGRARKRAVRGRDGNPTTVGSGGDGMDTARGLGCWVGGCALALTLTSPAFAGYELVWQDDFDGSTLDLTKWEAQIGTGCPSLCGWGNNELQYYRAENATVSNSLGI